MEKDIEEMKRKKREILRSINQTANDIISSIIPQKNQENTKLSEVLQIIDDFCLYDDDYIFSTDRLLFSKKTDSEYPSISIFNLENDNYLMIQIFPPTEDENFYFYIGLTFKNHSIIFGNTLIKGKNLNIIIHTENDKTIFEDIIPMDDIPIVELYEHLNEESIISLPQDFFLHLQDFIKKAKTIYEMNNGDYKYTEGESVVRQFFSKVSTNFSYKGDLQTFSEELQYFKMDFLDKDFFDLFDEDSLSVSYELSESNVSEFKVSDNNYLIELTIAGYFFSFCVASQEEEYGYLITLLPSENDTIKFEFHYLTSDDSDNFAFSSQIILQEDDDDFCDLHSFFIDFEKLGISIPEDFANKLYKYIYRFYPMFNYPDIDISIYEGTKKEGKELLYELNELLDCGPGQFFEGNDVRINLQNYDRNIIEFNSKNASIKLIHFQMDDVGRGYNELRSGEINFTKNDITINILCKYCIEYDCPVFKITKKISDQEISTFIVGLDNMLADDSYFNLLRNIKL